ncbi:L-lactate MFS transporter [Urbifossiella limnaea]|uniref:Putative MFS-type transporter YhjX n=1 Tax=Urbifossiella limnaea TaxID=2528023 RepID=A0A517XP78_9BACT|nr:MFS transporter [Urbifossiella limnaea]QDU19309.1 putative MFS-type transporter YhjX [Urbifossiella limnaea]
MGQPGRVPGRAWVVTGAGVAVNLCLGILYAWSVWKGALLAPKGSSPGDPMTGANAGWHYLSDAEATWAYAICGFTFALFMIPGGRLQDRYGPRAGATLAGLCLGLGCVVAGVMKSYLGLVVGFGLLGGIGMGLGYAAATPAAVRWFGPHRRGLIVGLVVGGYGGAAVYIAPLAKQLIAEGGLTTSFVALGVLFATVIVLAAQFLKMPPSDYVPPGAAVGSAAAAKPAIADVPASQVVRTWQFPALVALFVGSAQAGLLVIANAAPILNKTASGIAFFAANAWLLAAYGGIVNASGRVGTGTYSDRVGRVNAFGLNGLAAAGCLFALPAVIAAENVWLLFLMVGVVYWQYGGTLALMPAWTADFFGAKNLGLNYGLVFLGWGIAFFVPQIAGFIKDATGTLDGAFYLSGGLLVAAVVGSRFVVKPS